MFFDNSHVFNTFANLPVEIQRGLTIGIFLGAILTVTLFTQVQWYHDLVVWSWSTPWMYALGIPVGIAAAILTDKD